MKNIRSVTIVENSTEGVIVRSLHVPYTSRANVIPRVPRESGYFDRVYNSVKLRRTPQELKEHSSNEGTDLMFAHILSILPSDARLALENIDDL
jgi:hypothetical protein